MARKRYQRAQLIRQADNRWSVRFYRDSLIDGVRHRQRVQEYLGEFATEKLALRALAVKLESINTVTPRTTETFGDYADRWIEKCRTRKRKPLKPSTLGGWQTILDNHVLPVLEKIPLPDVGNGALRGLVSKLVEKKLSAQTIKNVVMVAKLVKASAIDPETGEQLYPTKWNHEFMDLPVVDAAKQRRPSFTGDQVTKLVSAANGRIQMLIVLLASSGLRAGEVLGLEVRHFDGQSIRIEQEVWSNRVQAPKTVNAFRQVDLHPDIAALLHGFIGDRKTGFIFRSRTDKPLSQTNLLKRELHPLLEDAGIPKCGFHSFRRFRNTFLRQSHCPPGVLKYWMGHADTDMSDRYDRSREDVQFRRDVARSLGTGFEIPKVLTPKPKKVTRSKVSEKVVSGVNGREVELAPVT